MCPFRSFNAVMISAIAISGFGTTEDVRKALASGFDSHMTKPLQLAILLDTLRAIAGREQERDTKRHTNLDSAKAGELMNLEFDILAKYVERMVTALTIKK